MQRHAPIHRLRCKLESLHLCGIALDAVLGTDYDFVFANSGTEAVEILQSGKNFDVILMDIQMPDMDGFEAATAIKNISTAKDIPIVFITAVYKEDPFFKRGYSVGGVDYFSKPFDPEILKMKLGIYASFGQRAEVLRERERQMRETEELLRVGQKLSAVLENLPVGVLISDVQGRICQINEQVARICNRTRLAAFDSYGEMLGWWDQEGVVITNSSPLYNALHNGKAAHSETIEIRCNDGESKRILCSASPLLGLDRHIVGAVVVLQDVTESKKIEADLEECITRVVSAGLELEESMAH